MDFDTTSTETTPSEVDTTTSTVTDVSTSSTPLDTTSITPPVIEEFTPNYKYKAYGKEFEVDEWARPLINKDNQDHMIKLYERAGGFDHLKNNFKELEQKHTTTEQQFNQLMSVRNAILTNIDKGDLDKAFQVIGLNEEQIMNYVRQKLEYKQLPPDQRQIVDHYRSQIEQRTQVESMLEQQRQMNEELMMQKFEIEVSQTFSNPKYSSIITDYNTRVGDENAFRNVVQQIGANEFYATGKNLPVAEATERAIKMLALNVNSNINQGMSAPGTQSVPTQPAQPTPKPIMKIGKGGGSTPINQSPRSIDDIKRLYEQNYGA